MKFLVDAQLPRRITYLLRAAGHDAIHTLDLPDENRTQDAQVTERANEEGRVVVTKDADFVLSFLLARKPSRLLLISTGNISNRDLDALLQANLSALVAALEQFAYVELSRDAVIGHV